MPLSWNQIKKNAVAFSKKWENEERERAEKDSFYNDFFGVFGMDRKRVATFEEPVKNLSGNTGFIDLFWKGQLLVEHKSKGKDLTKAYSQAIDYFPGLKDQELPHYILVSDFDKFRLYDLETKSEVEFHLSELHKNVHHFGFIAGYHQLKIKEQDPVNLQAARHIGDLHRKLEDFGFDGHQLEIYLVRLVFCMFADDAGIFEKDILLQYIENRTHVDGSDLGMHLSKLFQVLNKPKDKRASNLDEDLARFPYVNGGIFEEQVEIPDFDAEMRQILLDCSYLDWSKISPAIFGSMFQSVMDADERRNLGAHYTSEKNILKLIKPLFMDDLYEEFNKVKGNSKQLDQFHKKLSTLKFLDPACGCGNFLVITYRELRLLELEILRERHKGQMATGIDQIIWLDVDQFYGIEYDEWPARIAELAMWLMDHQMNMLISEEFGEYFARLPLRKSAKIVHGNALRIDWEDVVPKSELSYIIGNPPFVGHQWRTKEQMEDMDLVFGKDSKTRRLDYVAAWFYKSAMFTRDTNILSGLVSTNSITQGEQVPILWKALLVDLRVTIHFAHRTFNWTNEAHGKAAVHVVIIGFAHLPTKRKILFEYEALNGDPRPIKVTNINGYLAPAENLFITSRGKPMHGFPAIYKGSQPTDGGNFILNQSERDDLVERYPNLEKWIKLYLGGRELIQGIKRYCLWLKNCPPEELKKSPEVMERLQNISKSRLKSPTKSVQEYATMPSLFTQDRQPDSNYLAVPEVSSGARNHIPIGFLTPSVICSNQLQIIPNATEYLFGILMSKMHNTWKENICGRLKSDIRYSPAVYNNFPFPKDPSEKNKKKVEEKAQAVLDARAQFPDSSLADLYDPLTMPPALLKAHNELDKAVDLCYRPQPFPNETSRIEFLFDLYGEYTSPMFHEKKKKRKKKLNR